MKSLNSPQLETMFCWLLLALHVSVSTSGNTDAEQHIELCVAHIVRQHFQPGSLIAFSSMEESFIQSRVLRNLHKQLSWRITLFSAQIPSKEEEKLSPTRLGQTEKALGYIIFTNVTRIGHILNVAHDNIHWNSRARFLVVVSSRMPQSGHVVARDILAALWEKQVIHAVVLVASTSEAQVSLILQLFTWYPFHSPGNCGRQVQRATLMDTWTTENSGRFLQDSNLFPQKIPENLQGCPLHVAAFDAPPFVLQIFGKREKQPYYDGLEVRVLKTLSKMYNFTIVFDHMLHENIARGVQFHNKTWFKQFGRMIERVDICFGSLLPTPELFEMSDLTTGYLNNGLVWVVPKAQTLPPWRSVYTIFTLSTWLLLIIAYVCTSLVTRLLAFRGHKPCAEPPHYRSLLSSFMTVLNVHLGMSVEQPRNTALRMFFLLVAVYSLWVDTAFQSSLVTTLSVPRKLPQILTQENLLHSDLKLGAASDFHRLFDADSQVARRINTFCGDDNLQCLKRVSMGHFAFVADRALVQFLKKGHGRTPFKMIRTNVFSYVFGMVLPKGSMYLDNFNKVIHRINEACLMKKWRTDLANSFAPWSVKFSRNNDKKIKTPTTHGPQQFTIHHLHAPFFSLLARLAIAFVVFLIEIAVNYFKREQQTQVFPFVH